MGSNELIFFMHIPKTAGTTLRQIIQQQYGEEHIFSAYIGVGATTLQEHIDKLKLRLNSQSNQQSNQQLNQQLNQLDSPLNQRLTQSRNQSANQSINAPLKPEVKLILGHIGFGLHEILGRELKYMTFLRHPVDRVISWYYHQQRVKDAKYHQESQDLSLRELITTLQPIPTDNHQTRYLSGDWLQQQLGQTGVSYGECDRELFNQAKENLRQYFCIVGIQEDFDGSLALCKKVLQWQQIDYIPENIGKDKAKLAQSEIDFVAKCNPWDLELYEYAKTLFYQQSN
ncbi:MAG: sulfotransferase family 2 domain-containing protein [Coleofasciculaceae cyanobacterium SM2_1_6]|nr:sulfotransferase family 2 domain-containing protein [Coleofasciculaceae cyanobacterium SM2_1_6]